MNLIQLAVGFVPKRKEASFSLHFYCIGVLLLFFYSFTQIDLSLTITKVAFLQPIQQAFQYIGYFNRPLSSVLYLGILVILFGGFILLLRDAFRGKIAGRTVWFLIFFTTILLIFSYNSFSYDLFNYIFDAKIITNYHENPYLKKALDYPGDPMLSFMRWTHRVYPYGPTWLVFTVPLSLIGFQFFVVTFFLFKIAIAACFLGTAYFLQKIAGKLHSESAVQTLVFFALNPLVIIESLVSGHNDIVMLFFAILSLWYLIELKYIRSSIAFLFSVGIKFVTGSLLPVYLYIVYKIKKGQTPDWEKVIICMTAIMIIAMLLAAYRTNFQPWYFLYALPFIALAVRKKYFVFPAVIFSFCSLLQYLPYLFLGNYDPPVPAILFNMFLISGIVSVIVGLVLRLKTSRS